MKRAVICVTNPEKYIPELTNYSVMVVNPNSTPACLTYLLNKSDYSLLITKEGTKERVGNDYPNEKLFWYTSGTTGDSKFCSFTQEQLDHTATTICNEYNITANDRYTSVMPLWHAHGQGFYWATQRARCEVNYININQIKELSNRQPTFITAIPDILKLIGNLNFNSLRFIRSASAPLLNSTYNNLKDKFNVPVIEAFGMTEALSHCFTNPLHGEQRIGTIGLPSGIEAEIDNNKLYIRGPSVFVDTWYDTGDLALQDNQGYFKIIGRHKDQINVKGIKINPVSIETQLVTALPEIKECVIFGTDTVNCFYTGDIDPNLIKTFLLSVGKYLSLRLLERVNTIPLSPSGKISRSWLSSKYE